MGRGTLAVQPHRPGPPCRAALPTCAARARRASSTSPPPRPGRERGPPLHREQAGVVGLTRGLAVELGRSGVTVNCVCPGPIRTGMTAAIPDEAKAASPGADVPVGRYGDPEEVAQMTVSSAAGERLPQRRRHPRRRRHDHPKRLRAITSEGSAPRSRAGPLCRGGRLAATCAQRSLSAGDPAYLSPSRRSTPSTSRDVVAVAPAADRQQRARQRSQPARPRQQHPSRCRNRVPRPRVRPPCRRCSAAAANHEAPPGPDVDIEAEPHPPQPPWARRADVDRARRPAS